jgi:hypothetical protein
VSGEPSIESVVALQRKLGITTHLVYMGEERFVLAHTDPERSSGEPLDACEVHGALSALDALPVAVGYYRADVVDGRLELAALTDAGTTP